MKIKNKRNILIFLAALLFIFILHNDQNLKLFLQTPQDLKKKKIIHSSLFQKYIPDEVMGWGLFVFVFLKGG